jgi:hypothetical protein
MCFTLDRVLRGQLFQCSHFLHALSFFLSFFTSFLPSFLPSFLEANCRIMQHRIKFAAAFLLLRPLLVHGPMAEAYFARSLKYFYALPLFASFCAFQFRLLLCVCMHPCSLFGNKTNVPASSLKSCSSFLSKDSFD